VAATKMTALGFLGRGKRVTSVSAKTVRIRSTTCSRVIDPESNLSRISTSHAVPCCNMPSQKATAAEWGVKNGRMATGVGCKDPTMAACTPPETRLGKSCMLGFLKSILPFNLFQCKAKLVDEQLTMLLDAKTQLRQKKVDYPCLAHKHQAC
jgi:hypothetical protein